MKLRLCKDKYPLDLTKKRVENRSQHYAKCDLHLKRAGRLEGKVEDIQSRRIKCDYLLSTQLDTWLWDSLENSSGVCPYLLLDRKTSSGSWPAPWGHLESPGALQAMWYSAGHAKGTTSVLHWGCLHTKGVEEIVKDTSSQHSYKITRTSIFIFLSSKQQRGQLLQLTDV